MTPTPPSPEDDILDLSGLDMDSKKSKASTPESDFEKELEALFAEDLTEPEIKTPVSAAPAGEDILTLDDLAPEPAAPAAAQAKPVGDDVLDLGDFAAPEAPAGDDVLDLGAFAAPDAASAAAEPVETEDDVLDLGAFAAGGELDITPPDETAGGKDGGIDTAALDDLISGLGDGKEPEAKAEELPPHDDTDMSDLLETLNVSKAAAPAPAPAAEPADELLELSLGDLVEDAPAVEPLAAPEPAPAADLPDLDISLPDFSEPEPVVEEPVAAEPAAAAGDDLLPDLELAPADEDMGGDMNLSLPTDSLDEAPAAEAGSLLDGGDLDVSGLMEGGLMEGLEAAAEEPAPEQSLDPAALLDQIPDGPAPALEPEPAPLDGGDVGLGLAAAAAVGAGLAAKGAAPVEPVAAAALQELQEKLATLATQVMGGSVAVVRLEGQLAEKDQALSAMEQRLQASQGEADTLRRELLDLRGQLEESLRQRANDDKAATELKERLALVEDRQIQLDRDVRTEIERAVPREAARVIREEIAALAASMRDE